MQKNVLVYLGAALLVSNMHGASVIITNKTEERVVARINRQRRVSTFPKAAGKARWMVPSFPGGARARAAAGVPNFVSINPGSKIMLGTRFFKSVGGPKEGAIEKKSIQLALGREIESITFARVKEYTTVTGTLQDLARSKLIENLNEKYENIEVSIKERQYRDDLSGTSKKLEGKRGHTFSIKVPIMEQFTYTLPAHEEIGRFEKEKAALTSWGEVEYAKD